MKTLLNQINEVKYEISQCRKSIKVYENLVKELENNRLYCDHDWDGGVPGWEHEGRNCKNCGINEQYLETLKRQYHSK